MNDANFKASLAFTLKWEIGNKPNGGLTDDPCDLGGITKFGIAQRYHPDIDVKNLTMAQAAQIYRKFYWDSSGASELLWPLCLAVFDSSVNPGYWHTIHFLRQAYDSSKENPVDQALGVCSARQALYYELVKEHPSKEKYLHGWLNRVSDLRKTCLMPQPV